jgi:DNA-binding MarR family transcriptional regulator
MSRGVIFGPGAECGAEMIAPDLSNEFLSSARVFAWSVREVIEKKILRDVAGEKLSFAQLKLLYLVAHTDDHIISDAAAFLGVSNAAASKAVDKLVRRRLLRRVEVQADRRSSQLFLTEAGRRLIEAYEAARDQLVAKVFAQISPGDLRQTAEILDRLAGVIVSHGADPDAICLQCEVYVRDQCRFGEVGRRKCFYKLHRSEKPAPVASPATGAK